MSTGIIYNSFFVALPNGPSATQELQRVGGFELDEYKAYLLSAETSYFWVMQAGSSNSFDQSGRPARSWSITGFGSGIMNRCITMSMDVESEMIRPNNRSSTPEAFIKATRAKLKEALRLEDLWVPRVRWSLGAELLDESVPEPTSEMERRFYHAAVRLRTDPYTKHLVEKGRLSIVTDSWPYNDRKVVRFEAAAKGEDAFIADYLWLSQFQTYYAEPSVRTDCAQPLEGVFISWEQASKTRVAA